MNTEAPPSALRWRCRRGMQELDILLGRWLEHRWSEADEQLRDDFEALLACEDDRIWSWVTGREEPHQNLVGIIRDIREQAVQPGGD